LFISLLVYVLSGDSVTDPIIKQSERKVEIESTQIKPVAKIVKSTTPQPAVTNKIPHTSITVDEQKYSIQKPIISIAKKSQQKEVMRNPVDVQILDKRISRAVIAESLFEKEPVNIIKGTVNSYKDKAVGVYFFTEINQMKGQELYHQWLYNNRLIFKRKINVLGHHWRASTSKLITYTQQGEWHVMLVNKKGQLLAEVRFVVN
jgi:hypothetical protein